MFLGEGRILGSRLCTCRTGACLPVSELKPPYIQSVPSYCTNATKACSGVSMEGGQARQFLLVNVPLANGCQTVFVLMRYTETTTRMTEFTWVVNIFGKRYHNSERKRSHRSNEGNHQVPEREKKTADTSLSLSLSLLLVCIPVVLFPFL